MITQEVFAVHGTGSVAVAWTLTSPAPTPIDLRVRPFVSGRDYHVQRVREG